jgi:hypothetical protein
VAAREGAVEIDIDLITAQIRIRARQPRLTRVHNAFADEHAITHRPDLILVEAHVGDRMSWAGEKAPVPSRAEATSSIPCRQENPAQMVVREWFDALRKWTAVEGENTHIQWQRPGDGAKLRLQELSATLRRNRIQSAESLAQTRQSSQTTVERHRLAMADALRKARADVLRLRDGDVTGLTAEFLKKSDARLESLRHGSCPRRPWQR